MNLSKLFITRPVMTTLIMLVITCLGLRAYYALPVSAMPSVSYPVITISVSYPGASPNTMANIVATPIENECMTIDGLKKIASHSAQSSTSIVLEFDLTKPIDSAAQDVQAALNRANSNLPSDLPNSPTYQKVNPASDPILYLSFYSDQMLLSDIYNYAEDIISRRISMVEGVAQVQTYGSAFAVRIQVNPKSLAAKNLSFQDVSNAIKSGTVNLPTGSLYGSEKQFSLDVKGQLFNADGYQDIAIRQNKTGVLKLKDLGVVINSQSDVNTRAFYSLDGTQRKCIFLTVQKQPGANTIQIVQNIRKLLPTLSINAPQSLKTDIFFDKAAWIKDAIFDVKMTLLIAFLLVLCVVFLYLGKFVNTFIPMLVLPLSILGTFIFMYFLNYSIDILSLLAITLSIGFLIDDAIVVLENTYRHIEMGEDPKTAALKGAKEISITILSITLALVAVFIPMIFMPGLLGRIFREFSITIVIAVLFSGFLALSLTPLLCAKMISQKKQKISIVEAFSNRFNNFLIDKYKIGLNWSLDHGKTMLLVGLGCIFVSLGAFKILPKGFFPQDDLGILMGFSTFRADSSPQKSVAIQTSINKTIKEDPYVEKLVSVAGQAPGNSGIFFPVLTDSKKRPGIAQILSSLNAKLSNIHDANVFLVAPKLVNLDSSPQAAQGDYRLSVQSQNKQLLYKSLPPFLRKMKELPGFIGVNTTLQEDFPYLEISLDRKKIGYLNITASSIETALQQAYSQGKVTSISTPSNLFDVILQVEPAFYQKPQNLDQIYVESSTGKMVPLNNIATFKTIPGVQSVSHLNNVPSATIAFSLEDVSMLDGLNSLQELAKNELPEGVFITLEGNAQTFLQSIVQFIVLFFLAIFAIYAILGILYESFLHPLTAISAIPPATVGAFVTLVIFHQIFSIYAFVGLMMLLGIVMKNGILMIEFALQKIKEDANISARDAIFDACVVRFRPILMTTLAAMMGVIPIALGYGGGIAKSRIPLGLVIIGGLIFSQALTLFLTPGIFLYLENFRRKKKI